MAYDPSLVSLIVVVCSWVLIWLSSSEHEIHDSCQFMGCGYHGFGATMFRSDTAIESA